MAFSSKTVRTTLNRFGTRLGVDVNNDTGESYNRWKLTIGDVVLFHKITDESDTQIIGVVSIADGSLGALPELAVYFSFSNEISLNNFLTALW